MEMCYDGMLVMPSSYAVMDEEEMTYVDGGGSITINRTTINQALGFIGAALTVATIASLIVKGASKLFTVACEGSGILAGIAGYVLGIGACLVAAAAIGIATIYLTNGCIKLKF